MNDRAPLARRRHLTLTGVMLVGLLLTACTGDSSREAERGRERDASQESVVKDLQATETWLIINATPPASPPPAEE